MKPKRGKMPRIVLHSPKSPLGPFIKAWEFYSFSLSRGGLKLALGFRGRLSAVANEEEFHTVERKDNIMRGKAGLIFPVLMMLFGAYALLTAFGSSGEQVALIAGQTVPRGLGIAFGLIGLVGGGVVVMTSLSNRKVITQSRTR
jgi:hypothetical protein